jgi:hypothetical protein
MLAWGLGHVALGDRSAGLAWLIAELIGLAIVAYSVLAFADTTWYLLPFLLGTLFIGLWAFQAIRAFRGAERMQAARPPTPRGSPAAAIAWLTLPLLVWGTGFWLIGAAGASPAAVLDRFVSEWPEVATGGAGWDAGLVADAGPSSGLTDVAATALAQLGAECRAGSLNPDCATAPANLLHDVRMRITSQTDASATAVAESVDYVQQPTSVLFVFGGTELVPVARDTVLRLELVARPVHGPLGIELGARHWQIASASR